jgi:hypothetical protein
VLLNQGTNGGAALPELRWLASEEDEAVFIRNASRRAIHIIEGGSPESFELQILAEAQP